MREGRNLDYKCGNSKCGKPIRTNTNAVGMQCEYCGSKIFYKQRPNVKKVIKGR
ncbi:MAG TPA: DNA-directed RNA polymerase subunit P [Methanomassiliicoccales archaeon]|nr:DNA-directed RNA polymerase subunit P [Methanomassiliicoccales archaeon]